MTVDSLVGMAHAVEHGIGAAMLSVPDRRRAAESLAEPEPEHDTQIWILTHPDLRQSARIRAFVQFMFEELGRDVRLRH